MRLEITFQSKWPRWNQCCYLIGESGIAELNINKSQKTCLSEPSASTADSKSLGRSRLFCTSWTSVMISAPSCGINTHSLKATIRFSLASNSWATSPISSCNCGNFLRDVSEISLLEEGGVQQHRIERSEGNLAIGFQLLNEECKSSAKLMWCWQRYASTDKYSTSSRLICSSYKV